MKNNDLLFQFTGRREIRNRQSVREKAAPPKSHKASEGQRRTDLVLSEPAEWFIKAGESTAGGCRLKIGAPSLCLTDKEALIKVGSLSLKWLPYLAK